MNDTVFCPFHPRNEATLICSICNRPMCEHCNAASANNAPVCRSCPGKVAKSDSESYKQRQKQHDLAEAQKLEAALRKKNGSKKVQYAIIVIALFIIPLQLLFSDSSTSEVTINFSDQLEVEDQCIFLLFDIGEKLQEGSLPEPGTSCPGVITPVAIQQTSDDIVVSIVNPERFGYSSMQVSQNNPIPLLVD